MQLSTILDALTIHNTCAGQLDDSNLLHSLHEFQRVVLMIQNAVIADALGINTSPIGNSADERQEHQGVCPNHETLSQTIRVSVSPRFQPLCIQGEGTKNLYIYMCPFLIELETTLDSTMTVDVNTYSNDDVLDTRQIATIIAAILFNFAISHHRYGIIHGQDSSLVHASRLYLSVIDTLNITASPEILQTPYRQGVRTSYNVALLTLSLNNLAHAQYELCNNDICDRCLITLSNLFQRMSPENLEEIMMLGNEGHCNNRGTDASSFDATTAYTNPSDVMGDIRMNIMLWTLPFVAKAA